ncbi:MAG: hypothetical protein HOO97_07390 [Sideroxydans sp.]|nr:hypothetical protein [Sideroxydans sp.]
MKIKLLVSLIAIATLLSACAASYNSPDELRTKGHKTTAIIDAEHVMLYKEALRQMHLCWDMEPFRVNNDFVGQTSEITVGLYRPIYQPLLHTVIDMKAADTKTEIVVSGANQAAIDKIVDGLRFFGQGKASKLCNN